MPLRLIPAIHRATHQIGLYLDRAADLGLTQAEAHILSHLAEHGEAAVGELHRAFGHRRSTLTSILDRLAARGLVTRDVSGTDRRVFVVRLTKSGRVIAKKAYAYLEALERRALADASDRRLTELVSVLSRMADAATPPRDP